MPQLPYMAPDSMGVKQLTNVLQAYSVKKPEVGYCQGMNFLVQRLLSVGMTEEEAFWTLVMMIENYFPPDMYSNLIGVLVD